MRNASTCLTEKTPDPFLVSGGETAVFEDEPLVQGIANARATVVKAATLLVIFVCVTLLAMNAWLIVRARTHEIAQISLANLNLARAVTQQTEGAISEAGHVLDSLVFEIERSDVTPETLQRLQPALVNHVAGIDLLDGIFVYDAQGRWIVNSEASFDPTRNNADRAYFRHHQANQSRRLLVSSPVQSRSTGAWIIPLSRRIDAPDGSFDGVVIATLNVAKLRNMLSTFEIGNEGAIALALPDQILVRHPYREDDRQWRPNSTSVLQRTFASQGAGTAEARSTVDGVERLISFDHTKNHPILVTVAVGKHEALSDWRTASWIQTGWAVLLCLVVAAAGALVIQAMRLRIKAELGLRTTSEALTKANDQLAHLARFDSLTGLPNRRSFDGRLLDAFAQARRAQQPLSIVMVDVDEFKQYNDFYGHVQGDVCLQRVARALDACCRRPDDFIARYGGEEFVMLLPQTDGSGALQVAELGRQAVVDLSIPHMRSTFGQVSVSLGVATWLPESGTTPTEVLAASDAALYRAKHGGRNTVRL
jgi:diguanylate cyclase (GGDEF)-like protein